MLSEHRLRWVENIFPSDLIAFFSLFLQYATNIPSTQKWKKPHLLLSSKCFTQEVFFQVNIKYVFEFSYFFIVVHDPLPFKSILKCVSAKILRRDFERQTFLHICAPRKLLRNPKMLQKKKQTNKNKKISVYAIIWIPFWSKALAKRSRK